jgi:hypothetical protein
VTFAELPAKAACPAGYLATPIVTAKGDLTAEDIVCGSAAGCGCSAPTGTPTCSMRVRYFNDVACANSAGSDSVSAICRDLNSSSYLRVETTVSGLTCTSTGPLTVAPTVKPTPTYLEEWVVCAPDPNVPLAQCKMGLIGLPPASDAGACVISTDESCPEQYSQEIPVAKSGAFTDTRACSCSCGGAASTCAGGSATIFSQDTCGDAGSAFAIATCLPRNGDDGMTAVVPVPGTPACEARVTKSGMYGPTNDLHLCCLP